MAWMDNKTWTGLPVEESTGMTEDLKQRKYVHSVATLRSGTAKGQNRRELYRLTLPRTKWQQWRRTSALDACTAWLGYSAASARHCSQTPRRPRHSPPSCPPTSPSHSRTAVAPSATATNICRRRRRRHHCCRPARLSNENWGRDSDRDLGLRPVAVPRWACPSAAAPVAPFPPTVKTKACGSPVIHKGLFTARELNWTELNWPATSRPSYTTRAFVSCIRITSWLAAGLLVLSQFMRCKHSHWNTCVQN